jgi:hypothetical protein
MASTPPASVSRIEHLAKMFAALEVLECDRIDTGLLVYVDGDTQLVDETQRYVDQSKFAQCVCVAGTIPGPRREYSSNTRRRRIAAIHNEVRTLLVPCEYVLLLEDDSIPPPHALKHLAAGYLAHPHAGFIEGVELGRWGIPYVGAWRADDVYEPRELVSVLQSTREVLDMAGRPLGAVPDQLEQIDAGGLYACLTRYKHYVGHEFRPYEACAFGPDIEWGLWQQGYQNYIHWGVQIEHRKPDGTSVHPRATEAMQMRFERSAQGWNGQVV